MYTYRIIKEDFHTGQQGKHSRTIIRNRPLTVGGLYVHLPRVKGCWRVLEQTGGEKL